MSDTNDTSGRTVTRRRLLQGSGAVALTGLGAVPAAADERDDGGLYDEEYCQQTSFRPKMAHYDHSIDEVCDDDHPETQERQDEVDHVLEEHFPTVGALIDDGFIPYLDFFGDASWAHWINPEYVGDDELLDAHSPESILVDNTYWRPIGVMFIATEDGEPVDPPPSVYSDDESGACSPWHAHVGVPGRSAWWKYRKVHGDIGKFPCRTPWMLHVWRYDHEESIYAHAAPEERGGAPAEEPGFETDADPDEEELGPEHLPDAVHDKAREMESLSKPFGWLL